MPLALQVDGQIQRWMGQTGPQGGVRSAAIVMR
jgi:hypothetical protein